MKSGFVAMKIHKKLNNNQKSTNNIRKFIRND